MNIETPTDLSKLYMEAWSEQYSSKLHNRRSAELGYIRTQAATNPNLFGHFAAQAEKCEAKFQKELEQ